MENFQESSLNDNIIKALKDIGFTKPTLIQKHSILHSLNSNRDLMAISQTGTGKTAAFGLPVINNITHIDKYIQALIICPTRELCVQITKDLLKYSKYLPLIKITSIYGGVNIKNQIRSLKNNTHIVIGTPGRIIDLISRTQLKLQKIKYLIIDEADEMLNMGFKEDLDRIIKVLPVKRQSFLFSATMSSTISKVANSYLYNPVKINISKKNIVSDYIKHFYYIVDSKKNKYLALKRIVDANPDIYSIIFCCTRKTAKELSDSLISDGYSVDSLYGDLSQVQRESVMQRFRKKKLKLLVATDIASRGIDIKNITHIIHYNLPNDNKIYIHRSGRTGRAKNNGISICIINDIENYKIKSIEKNVGKKFQKLDIPNSNEIYKNQFNYILNKLLTININNNIIDNYIKYLYNKLSDFNKEDIIKRFISLEFSKFTNNDYDIDINFKNYLKNKSKKIFNKSKKIYKKKKYNNYKLKNKK